MRLDRGESTENTNQTIKIGFSEELEELSKWILLYLNYILNKKNFA
jgi:hypothetical protein